MSENPPLSDRETNLDSGAAVSSNVQHFAELIADCESKLDYEFRDQQIVLQALTHSSRATTRLDCNERMEFLGDAILGVVICEYLYERYPDFREGQLTQIKSHIVSRAVCAKVADALRLQDLMLVGKGLRDIPDSMKAAVVESLIAAIYLDGGFDEARHFIRRVFRDEIDQSENVETDNYKSLLQEETQRHGRITPQYVIVEQRGPDHAREFNVAVQLGERTFDSAWGRSKKQAEQKAARIALDHLDETDDPDHFSPSA